MHARARDPSPQTPNPKPGLETPAPKPQTLNQGSRPHLIPVLVLGGPLKLSLLPRLGRPQAEAHNLATSRMRRARNIPHQKGAPRHGVTPCEYPHLVVSHLGRAKSKGVRPLRHVGAVAGYVGRPLRPRAQGLGFGRHLARARRCSRAADVGRPLLHRRS